MEIIWEAVLDDIYECKVKRTGEGSGHLTLTDIQNTRLLFEKDVQLLYGAKFGPDVDDVADWMDACANVVDNLEE